MTLSSDQLRHDSLEGKCSTIEIEGGGGGIKHQQRYIFRVLESCQTFFFKHVTCIIDYASTHFCIVSFFQIFFLSKIVI